MQSELDAAQLGETLGSDVFIGAVAPREIPASQDGLTPTWAWVLLRSQLHKEENFKKLKGLALEGDLERRI